jgi:hypothetical protein
LRVAEGALPPINPANVALGAALPALSPSPLVVVVGEQAAQALNACGALRRGRGLHVEPVEQRAHLHLDQQTSAPLDFDGEDCETARPFTKWRVLQNFIANAAVSKAFSSSTCASCRVPLWSRKVTVQARNGIAAFSVVGLTG